LYGLIRKSADPGQARGIVAINRILRVAARVRRSTEATAARLGLRAADVGILMVIDRGEASGPVRIRDVSHILRVTPGGISKRLDGLEASGLVVRRTHAGDARAVDLVLTAAGRAIVTEARSANPETLQALTEREWRQLDELLTKLTGSWTAD